MTCSTTLARVRPPLISVWLVATMLFWVAPALGQLPPGEVNFEDAMRDAFEEIDGFMTLRFYDAITGDPLDDVQVRVSGGAALATDFEGAVRFEPLPNGYHVVEASKRGYISVQTTVEVMAGSLWHNRITMSEQLPITSYRIVLEWGDRPADLDAHLVKEGSYHISYRDTRAIEDIAQLDRDDTNGEGPETVTIDRIDASGSYTYFVHDYTNRNDRRSGALARSRAQVRVYGNNQLLETISIPDEGRSNRWAVFMITSGRLEVLNRLIP